MREISQADYRGMSRQARELNDEIAKLSNYLSRVDAVGTSPDGMVTATVSGNGLLVALELDPSVMNPDDPAAAAEPIIDAVNTALNALTTQHRERIAPLAETFKNMTDRLSERH